jgi:hypothetical protein
MRARLIEAFAEGLVEREIRVPYDKQARRADIFAVCQVLEERYEEDAVVFRVKAPRGFE